MLAWLGLSFVDVTQQNCVGTLVGVQGILMGTGMGLMFGASLWGTVKGVGTRNLGKIMVAAILGGISGMFCLVSFPVLRFGRGFCYPRSQKTQIV